jgi:SAM-dependent methyltransferase
MSQSGPHSPHSSAVAAAEGPSRFEALRDLFLITFTLLFMEMACIRWFPGHVVFLSFFTNTILLACFLGMSVGCILASSKVDHLKSTPDRLALALAIGIVVDVLADKLERLVDVGHQTSPQLVFFGTEHQGGDLSHFFIPIWIVNGVFFFLVALAMIGPGQELGRAFDRIPRRVVAYTANILGSIAGILVFAACSWLEVSPFWWFLIIVVGLGYFLRSGGARFRWRPDHIALLVVVLGLASVPSGKVRAGGKVVGEHLWSPYYRIDYYAPARSVNVNLFAHQQMVSRSNASYPGFAYSAPYLLSRDAGMKPFKDVLIIGAGTGNDLSRALQWGVERVDAVEIDPVILRLGRQFHPDRPYQDPRVHIHLGDGRNFLRSTHQQYDLIIYALVDSLILNSSYSNIRLESFLFTRQAFEDVRRHLRPGGVFSAYNAFRQGWIVERLSETLTQVFNSPPLVMALPYREKIFPDTTGGFTMLLAGNVEGIRAAFERNPGYWVREGEAPGAGSPDGFREAPPATQSSQWVRFGLAQLVSPADLKVPTDDWPYLYLRRPMIPTLDLNGMGIMALLAVMFLLYPFRRRRQSENRQFDISGRMFFLGAGFMLLETEAVVHMALLFGSTWMVNTVVFVAVLAMILGANLFVLKFKPGRLHGFYAALLVALGLNVVIPLGYFLGMNPSLQVAGSCLLVFTPIFFAGIIFAASFDRSQAADVDFGVNIAGAMFGGLAEYASTLLGFQHLVLIAVAFYLLSAVLYRSFNYRLAGSQVVIPQVLAGE